MLIKYRLLLLWITLWSKVRLALAKRGVGIFARVLRLQVLLWWRLKYELRLLVDASRSEGFDPTFDKVVHLAALRLAMPYAIDENVYKLRSDLLSADHIRALDRCDGDERKRLRLEYEENKEAVDQLLANHGGASTVSTTLASYFQLESFLQNCLGNKEGQEYYMNVARNYDPEVLMPDIRAIRALGRKTQREIKSLKTSISDREALKISLSGQNLPAVLTVVSTLFLVSGYLYSRAFLGYFGVEVAKYFALSDYVAASIDGIHYAVVAAVGASLGNFLGAHSLSRMPFSLEVQTRRKRRIQYSLVTAMLGVGTASTYVRELEEFYSIAPLFIFLLSYRPVSWLVCRYVKAEDRVLAIFVILAILAFSLYLFASVRKDIYRIEHTEASDLKQYDIVFKEPVVFSTDAIVLLAANGGYVFLRDASSGKVYIIPRDQIQNISVRNEEPVKHKVP